MTEHTNWKVGKPQKFHDQHYTPIEEPLMGELMTDVCWVVSGEDAARFIVTACNCHADLLEALQLMLQDHGDVTDRYDHGICTCDACTFARKVIRKFEETQ